MKVYKSLRKDNRGSTLLMVIIGIAFISILCSLLLSLTVINIKMKSMNYQAQENFYETEEVLEKMKMGIEEEAAEAMKYAYEEVMKVYISNTEEQKKVLFEREFLDKLESLLMDTVGTYKEKILTRYTRDIPGVTLDLGERRLEKTDEAIKLKSVKVSCEDEHNYQTTISTDIVIELPDMGFHIVPNFPPAYSTYSLLADHQVKVEQTIKGTKVIGDVYAGNGGILLETDSELTFENPANLVTRGNITVKNSSILTVTGLPAIWAKNIETKQGGTEGAAKININGKCYIKDDLTLDAKNSNVTICGDYFGYGYNSEKTAESSSAVIINGSGSTLNMEETKNIIVSGRAYINTDFNEIQTGESLAIKNNQYAYLVPDEYMWCGTNPVSLDDYKKFLAEKKEHPEKQEVNFNKDSEFKISNYTTEVTKVFSLSYEKLVYYYLTFPTEESANRYLQDYYMVESNRKSMDNWIAGSGADIKVKGPQNTIVSVGNVVSYSNAKSDLIPNQVNMNEAAGGESTALSFLKKASSNLEERYEKIIHTLSDMSTKTPLYPDSLFHSIVKSEAIETDISAGTGKTVTVGESIVYIVNNKGLDTFRIDGSRLQGMVIATGSVRVSKDFTGLILSGDTIQIDNNVTITANNSIVEDIISANKPEVNKYLRDYCDSLDTDDYFLSSNRPYDVSDLIVYENWTMNEE